MKEPMIHESVMTDEVVRALHIKNQALYIDCTLGTGGHTQSILKSGGKVLGIDLDPEMVARSYERLSKDFADSEYRLVTDNFSNIDKIVEQENWKPVSGILIDLGVSNLHLKNEERGFSFGNPSAPLDMRLNTVVQGVTAADLLNVLREDQLTEMFSTVLERGPARWLTARIIEFRKDQLFNTVSDFLTVCRGLKVGKFGLSEATLPFLALRIAVNGELDNLRIVLPKAYNLLDPGGYLVVISFHSGEDKIVKEFLRESELVLPSEQEVLVNPRARSAKMRVIQKIQPK